MKVFCGVSGGGVWGYGDFIGFYEIVIVIGCLLWWGFLFGFIVMYIDVGVVVSIF